VDATISVKLGFMGSRGGMTQNQVHALTKVLKDLDVTEVHHNDVHGAAHQFHNMANRIVMGASFIAHPPNTPKYRAFCNVSSSVPPSGYLQSGKQIVDATDLLVAAPRTDCETRLGLTWKVVRYARNQKKNLLIIRPNGQYILEINDGSK